MKKGLLFLSFAIMAYATPIYGYWDHGQIEVNGFCYLINTENHTAEVTWGECYCTNTGHSPCNDCASYPDLQVANIPSSIVYNGQTYQVTRIGEFAFGACSNLSSVTIPNSVTSIGQYAFQYCTSITSIEIPQSVSLIEFYAFAMCSSLKEVKLVSSIPLTLNPYNEHHYHGDIFYGTSCDFYVPCGSLETYKTADGWTGYASRIKYDVYLASIASKAEHGVVSTDKDVVTVCDDPYVTLTAIPDYGYQFFQWNDGNTDNPRTIELYQDTTFVAEFTFAKYGTCGVNNALTWEYEDKSKSLTISGKGELTENYTFGLEAPTQMQNLIIGNEVTAIGDRAFYATNTLNHLTIGGNVASIGDYAFAECKNFDDITSYATTVPIITEKTFENVGNKQYIYLYVPEDRERAYKRDVNWGQFDIQIKGAETTNTDGKVTIVPTDNTVEITWPSVANADTYEIVITKDGEVVCTLIFNADGQLAGIAFAPSRNNTQQAQTTGFRFTVTGLTNGTNYGYKIASKNASGVTINEKSGSFTTTGGAQGIDQITNDPYGVSRSEELQITNKILRNGQILILRGDKIYTMTGQEVK